LESSGQNVYRGDGTLVIRKGEDEVYVFDELGNPEPVGHFMRNMAFMLSALLAALLSIPAEAAPKYRGVEAHDRGWPVCNPFVEKANEKLELSYADALETMSKIPSPEKTPIPKERAAYIMLQMRRGCAVTNNGVMSESSWKGLKNSIEGYYSGKASASTFIIDAGNDGVLKHVMEFRRKYGEWDTSVINIVTDAKGNPAPGNNDAGYLHGELKIFDGATYTFELFIPYTGKDGYLEIYRPGTYEGFGLPNDGLNTDTLCKFDIIDVDNLGTVERAKP
jgi:hypothetical protein